MSITIIKSISSTYGTCTFKKYLVTRTISYMLSTDHVMKLEFKPNLGYNVLRILSSSQTLEIFGTRHVESWCLIKSPRLKIYLIQKKKKNSARSRTCIGYQSGKCMLSMRLEPSMRRMTD